MKNRKTSSTNLYETTKLFKVEKQEENTGNFNTNKIRSKYISKKEDILKRVKSLGIRLDEEDFKSMFELDQENMNTNHNIRQYKNENTLNLSMGNMKNQISQTNLSEDKIIETEKVYIFHHLY